jgi:hypothetical protein
MSNRLYKRPDPYQEYLRGKREAMAEKSGHFVFGLVFGGCIGFIVASGLYFSGLLT